MKTVKTFKYVGSLFDANGRAEKDVNNRVKIAWSKLRETTGVMCDSNIPTKLKNKVYKTAIKPAMVYGAECWSIRKKQERILHTTEMRMLQWARGKMRLDHVRNVELRDIFSISPQHNVQTYVGRDWRKPHLSLTPVILCENV